MRLLCDNLVMRLSICVTILVVVNGSHAISTKLDFEEDASPTKDSSAEDVEVKHTIVVSTKLKNNERRGLHSHGDRGSLTYNTGHKNKAKEDSGEVPVFNGYKAVDSTIIRTPDTRNKPKPPQTFIQTYPDVFINRNIRDGDDIFPNIEISNPEQWKPSSFYNNINYWGQEIQRDSNFLKRIDQPYLNQAKLHRKITQDATKEYYCRKCKELSCESKEGIIYPHYPQPRSLVSLGTTPKIKIDGKIAKLN